MRRWTWFWVGLAASLAVTAALWWAGIPGGAFFLMFPFFWLPWARRERATSAPGPRTCPEVRFCPRDGTPIDR
jgi:hypothetical protein